MRFLMIFILFAVGLPTVGWAHQSVAYIPEINNYNHVLVRGFLNELAIIPGKAYYQPNVRSLLDMGAEHVSVISPSSKVAIADNRALLKSEFLRKYEEGGRRPLIVEGHSKGGVEVLATILEYPELVRDGVIKKVVIMQALIGGNGLFDVIGPGFQNSIQKLPFQFLDGLKSASTAHIESIIVQKIAGLDSQTRKMLSDATLYVISNVEAEKASPVIRSTVKLMSEKGVKGDGAVAEQDMWIRNFGKVILRIQADHLQLFMPNLPKAIIGTEEESEKFTEKMMRSVLKDIHGDTQESEKLTQQMLKEDRKLRRWSLPPVNPAAMSCEKALL